MPTATLPMLKALQFAGKHGGIAYPAAHRTTTFRGNTTHTQPEGTPPTPNSATMNPSP